MASSIPTRRQALQTAGVAAAAWTCAAPLIHAADKSGSKRPIVGNGAYQYECFHDWGRDNLPREASYGNASHGVAIDSSGLVYITHYGDPGSVFVFDPDGKFVKSMGAFHQLPDGPQNQLRASGHGIDIRREGSDEFLYLSASDPRLDFVKSNLQGEVVWRKGRQLLHEHSQRYPEGAPYRPTNISFAPDGGYFLGDGYGSSLIHQYDAQDNYVRTIGGKGSEDGQFDTPHGQWLDDRDGDPLLVVADRANKRLQWFNMEGDHVKTLDGFLFPADIDIQGELMVVPDLHARVTLLDQQNQVVAQLGDDAEWRESVLDGGKMTMRNRREEWRPGRFVHPHDACFDAQGNLFVTEWVNTGRVSFLRKLS